MAEIDWDNAEADEITAKLTTSSIDIGDKFTFTGTWIIPNPERCWWAFWRPRKVKVNGSRQYKVIGKWPK